MGGVETHRGGLCGATALSRIISEGPRGARITLKEYSGNEAVRFRGQGLASTSTLPNGYLIFSKALTALYIYVGRLTLTRNVALTQWLVPCLPWLKNTYLVPGIMYHTVLGGRITRK